MTSIKQQGGRPRSRLVHAGRPTGEGPLPVNPPIVRATTIVHRSVAEMRRVEARRADGERVMWYGRRGTDTAFALEDALVELESGHGARLTSSGLAANVLVFLAYLQPGDHVLISDCVYGPVRRFATTFMPSFGIEHEFFAADDPQLAEKLRAETKLVYVESPGSVLFELVDLPKLAGLAHERGVTVAVDSTWGSGWCYKPLALGADVCVIAATKYLAGHSDVHLGAVVAGEGAWAKLDRMADTLGVTASPEDAYLALRGLRTLAVRMSEHEKQARSLIDWFKEQPQVRRVFYPALPEHPGHEIWERDFTGACGLFSVEYANVSAEQIEQFVDRLTLFGLGASWGGFESLVRIEDLNGLRSVSRAPSGMILRFHAGFEDTADLIADLDEASTVLRNG